MDDINKSEDALFETLMIDKSWRSPCRPHYYSNGRLWEDWWGWATGPLDAVYINKENVYHRIYGPAYVSTKYGIEAWYKDGNFHRLDGPAYQHKGSKFWLVDGKFHRLDGPAVDAKGHPKEYWIGGQRMSPKIYKKEIERRKRKGLIK
jgi:hypothetical protein